MAEQLPDVVLNDIEYKSLNSLAGVPVGTEMSIQNKSVTWGNLIESSTQPLLNSTLGTLITNLPNNSAEKRVPAGSLEIWGISLDSKSTLSVQEV
jgi:hypothetical protein